jgi:hypothetical protein
MHILTLSPETTMLTLALLVACAEEPPAAAKSRPPREHHAAVPTPTVADDEGEAPSMGERNREPVVRSIHVKPSKPSKLDTMEVTVNATDPEHEELRIDYEWSVNGNRVYGPSSPTLPLADYTRGDTVQVTVRVRDSASEVHGTSELYTIGNADPQFEGKPTELRRIDGSRIEATDPDGDAVTFRLEGAPAGLTLDRGGTLRYVGSETEAGGKYTLRIIAEDGMGGKGTLELPLTLSPGSKAPAPPTAGGG